MKKIEILEIINANRKIDKNEKLLSITKDKRINRVKDKYYWFPKIEELKKEFDILSKEIEQIICETKTNEKKIKNSNCNHEVRLEHYGLFGSTYNCIFCGKKIKSDNYINWEYSVNRNKYCVNLVAKYQNDEDNEYVDYGYTKEQVYDIIINIIKDKKDNDEIDLIQEFKHLNLLNCKINEEKKKTENYILIISGSNKKYIDNESYIFKNNSSLSLDFTKFFSEILNTKVELIDNKEILTSEEYKKFFTKENSNLKFTSYETINELENILSNQKDIPFKIVIDLSELYNYNINNNVIKKEEHKLDIKKHFPNSKIIKISNLSTKSIEELSEYLHNFYKHYTHKDKKYYNLENNEIKPNDFETTCNDIKKLLKKGDNYYEK